jgi:hypothetical protein
VIALSAQPPDTQALALRRRGGLRGYHVPGSGTQPRHIRGPGAAGLRSALGNSEARPRLRVSRVSPRNR